MVTKASTDTTPTLMQILYAKEQANYITRFRLQAIKPNSIFAITYMPRNMIKNSFILHLFRDSNRSLWFHKYKPNSKLHVYYDCFYYQNLVRILMILDQFRFRQRTKLRTKFNLKMHKRNRELCKYENLIITIDLTKSIS